MNSWSPQKRRKLLFQHDEHNPQDNELPRRNSATKVPRDNVVTGPDRKLSLYTRKGPQIDSRYRHDEARHSSDKKYRPSESDHRNRFEDDHYPPESHKKSTSRDDRRRDDDRGDRRRDDDRGDRRRDDDRGDRRRDDDRGDRRRDDERQRSKEWNGDRLSARPERGKDEVPGFLKRGRIDPKLALAPAAPVIESQPSIISRPGSSAGSCAAPPSAALLQKLRAVQSQRATQLLSRIEADKAGLEASEPPPTGGLNTNPFMRTKYATLKINKNLEKEEKIKQVYSLNKGSLKSMADPSQNQWFDPTLKTSSNPLKKQGLRFLESGFYLRRQQQLDMKFGRSVSSALNGALSIAEQFVAKQEGLKNTSQAIDRHADDNIFPAVAAAGSGKRSTDVMNELGGPKTGAVPEMEWWDLPLVKPTVEEAETSFPYSIVDTNISHLVEHPVPVEPIAEKDSSSIQVCMFLTEEERKKMRKKRRREREQEKRDKIRMGLIPPEAPKAKLANLMRVLGEEAVAGPTVTEMKVKKQVKDRFERHEARNLSRKLTAEKKAEKARAKWVQKEETSTAISVAVFMIPDVLDKRVLYKIHMNSRQFHFTGAAVLYPGVANMVVVEGGPRAVKRYKGLLLRRIKWSEQLYGIEEMNCRVVWEGVVAERVFKTWKICPCSSEIDVKKSLADPKAVSSSSCTSLLVGKLLGNGS